jgi:diguanylate cyclase (GGDEF)-like protein
LNPLDTTIAVLSGQGVFALLLALFLVIFLLEFRHRFLLPWALSCMALAVHHLIAAMLLYQTQAADAVATTSDAYASIIVASAGLHALWLVMGAFEASRNRLVQWWLHWPLVAFVMIIGSILPLGSSGLLSIDTPLAMVPAISTTHIMVAAGFLVSGLLLWRSLTRYPLLSSRLVPIAFGLFAIFLVYLGLTVSPTMPETLILSPTVNLGLTGLLLQVLIGFSIVIWLLEIERRRSSRARDKAQSAEERLTQLRMNDPATGLPNRRQLQELLAAEVRSASGKRNRVAVLAIGIERFRVVSQALGWQKSDQLILKMSQKVLDAAPRDAILGRIGEHEFLMILPNVGNRERAMTRINDILTNGSGTIEQDGRRIYLKLSGGLCFAPDDHIDAVVLVRMARQTQAQAAASGQVLEVCCPDHGDGDSHNLLELEHELRDGVKNKEFQLHYQPLVSIRQRRIIGFEGLLRWQHPKRGLLTPGSFLHEASRLDVLNRLEDDILMQALNQLSDWQNELALPPLSISINLSAQRFQQSELVTKLDRLCQKTGVNPSGLHLEITESTAMQDFEAGLKTISKLRGLGCKVCLDDFGTGYSSLSHLRRLQVDYVKLDRSFIKNLERDQHERDMIRAIVDLIHSLGMTVLAEGVENKQQLGYLIHCRVDVVQGYLFGRPQSAEEYRGVLEQPELVLG